MVDSSFYTAVLVYMFALRFLRFSCTFLAVLLALCLAGRRCYLKFDLTLL